MSLSKQIWPWLLAFVIAVTPALRHYYWQLDKFHFKTRKNVAKTRELAKPAGKTRQLDVISLQNECLDIKLGKMCSFSEETWENQFKIVI